MQESERVLAAGQADENTVAVSNHLELLDGLEKGPEDVLRRRPPPALHLQRPRRVRPPALRQNAAENAVLVDTAILDSFDDFIDHFRVGIDLFQRPRIVFFSRRTFEPVF